MFITETTNESCYIAVYFVYFLRINSLLSKLALFSQERVQRMAGGRGEARCAARGERMPARALAHGPRMLGGARGRGRRVPRVGWPGVRARAWNGGGGRWRGGRRARGQAASRAAFGGARQGRGGKEREGGGRKKKRKRKEKKRGGKKKERERKREIDRRISRRRPRPVAHVRRSAVRDARNRKKKEMRP